jgi:hypothetical protein
MSLVLSDGCSGEWGGDAMRSEVQQIQSEHNNLFMFNSYVFRPVSQWKGWV